MSLLAGALISGVLGLGKAVVGGIQSAKGNKQMKNLLANRPQYSIPEAYMKSLGIYQQMAASEMPGKDYYEQKLGETTARAMTGAERGAISSNVYQGAVESAQDKELQAIQDLAKMNAEYKMGAMQNLAGAQQQMGALQQEAWNYNVNQPWQIKANMANEKRQAGASNLFSGMQDIGSSVMNYVGTKYYGEILKGLQTPPSSVGGQQFSKPLNNIVNAASGLMRKTPVGLTDWQNRQQNYLDQGITPEGF